MENNYSNDYQNNYSVGNQALPNATATLILGIFSIVGCLCYALPGLICGIIALVLYKKDKNRLMENPNIYSSNSIKNSNAGRICAIIGLSLAALYVISIILTIAFFGWEIISNPEVFLEKYQYTQYQ